MTPSTPIRSQGRIAVETEVPECIRTYFDALNAEDWPRLAGIWSGAAELRAVGSRPRRGREEIMAYFRPLFAPWAEHEDEPTRFILAGDTAVVEVTFTGVSRAGQELRFDAVDVFDLENGVIARLSTWYDLAWLRKQL